jgi:hydroxyacylglutathione hydrolase
MRLAREQGLRITDILETHVHADFISGAVELKARLPYEARIHCSGLGGADWTAPYADAVIGDQDEISFGSLRLRALHTPGHTLEHVCWALFDQTRSDDAPWVLFTGDFLFVGDVGRPDLLIGDQALDVMDEDERAATQFASIHERLFSLPDHVEVFPNHYGGSTCGGVNMSGKPASTIGFERRFNLALRQPDAQAFARFVHETAKPFPDGYRRIKAINLGLEEAVR